MPSSKPCGILWGNPQGFSFMTIEDVAKVCHEANRTYCASIGDDSQLPWDQSPDWQRQSAINGVKFHLDNPGVGPAASHENWVLEKLGGGWKYGPIKDADAKKHPCIVPYDQLPPDQRLKDSLFIAIVNALKTAL